MKRPAARATGMLAVSILIAVFAVAPVAFAEGANVTICHSTGAVANPYIEQTVDQSSIFNGVEAKGHGLDVGSIFTPGMTSGWGDIIPAFGAYPGLNTGPDGRAWLDRDCNLPPNLKLVKEVVGSTVEATAWTLRAVGPAPATTSFQGTSPAIHAVEAGEYALSEFGGPSGYTPSVWYCGKDNTVVGGTVTINRTDVKDVTCTITNTLSTPPTEVSVPTLVLTPGSCTAPGTVNATDTTQFRWTPSVTVDGTSYTASGTFLASRVVSESG